MGIEEWSICWFGQLEILLHIIYNGIELQPFDNTNDVDDGRFVFLYSSFTHT